MTAKSAQIICELIVTFSHVSFPLVEYLGIDAVDQTSEAGSVVHRLTEEMRLMERLIPCDNIELRDCIGQGELF